MQKINIFVKKGEYFNLTDSSEGDRFLYNPPMYNTEIHLYKGIDNTVQFSVRDNDRKAFRLRDKELTFVMLNHSNHQRLEKTLWQVDAYKGIYELTVTEKEMKDFDVATYQASVVSKDLDGNETMLYSSINYDPVFNVKVDEGFREIIKPTIELDPKSFNHSYYTSKIDGQRFDYYTSSKIKADDSDIHTLSVSTKDYFIGRVRLEGSMEVSPQDSREDWFIIDEKDITNETKSEAETFGFNKQVNCLWVRVVYEIKALNDKGYISEILYRN